MRPEALEIAALAIEARKAKAIQLAKGEKGDTGPAGKDGADGKNGIDGAEGPQGSQGEQGPPGRDGKDGTPGRDGRNGRDGADGPPGPAGADGADGKDGDIANAWRGNWKPGEYEKGLLVQHKGSTWISDELTSREPGGINGGWSIFAAKGRDGFVVAGGGSSGGSGGAVDSVNGQTGAVTLDAGDVGADAAGTAAAAVVTHTGLSDPHTQYALESALGNASTRNVGTSAGTVAAGDDSRFPTAGQKTALAGTSGTPGTGNEYVTDDDPRNSDARTPTSHSHGNITNAGAIGSTADLPVKTTTSGVLTVGAFGTSAGQFCQGNDARLTDQRTPSDDSVTLAKLSPYLRVFGARNARRVYENRARLGATTRLVSGTGAGGTFNGTAGTAALSSDGVLQTFTTAATVNAIAGGLMFDSEAGYLRSNAPRALFRIKASASTTDLRIFVGMTDVALGAADDPATPAAVFRYSTSASDPGWVCVTRSGGLSVSGSVRAYTASEVLLMGIDFEDTGTARFWLGTSEADIAVVHTTTSNLFNIASQVGVVVSVGAVAASARAISFDRATLIF